MGWQYTYSTWWAKQIVVIVHISGARPIFLQICYHQDTESKLR